MTRKNSPQQEQAKKPWWQRGAVRVILAAFILWWIFRQVEWDRLAQLSSRIRWWLVLCALAIQLFNRLLTTFKWRLLMRAKQFDYPFSRLLRVVWISNFMGHFLPSAVGGDNVRMLTMARGNARAPDAISTVLMERMTGVASLAMLALAGGVWSFTQWGERRVLIALALPLSLILFGFILLWTRPGHKALTWILGHFRRLPGQAFLSKVHAAVHEFRHQPRAVFGSFLVSVAIQVNRVIFVYLLSRALNLGLYFGEALVLIPPVLCIAMLPISVGGLGVQEGAFVLLLRRSKLRRRPPTAAPFACSA